MNSKSSFMRHTLFAGLSAAGLLATILSISPAAASDEPSRYCLQSIEWGWPGNCQFSTYEQCMATASGTDAGCGINPAYAFALQHQAIDPGRRPGPVVKRRPPPPGYYR
jgi:Protein of unknown function (DUF3551)